MSILRQAIHSARHITDKAGRSLTASRACQQNQNAHICWRVSARMLLSRDFVGYMANELVKRLVANKMLEAGKPAALAERIRLKMSEEIGIEDRLNEEVREILSQHAEEMRRTGVSYQEMYKKVKGELARQRKLILR